MQHLGKPLSRPRVLRMSPVEEGTAWSAPELPVLLQANTGMRADFHASASGKVPPLGLEEGRVGLHSPKFWGFFAFSPYLLGKSIGHRGFPLCREDGRSGRREVPLPVSQCRLNF